MKAQHEVGYCVRASVYKSRRQSTRPEHISNQSIDGTQCSHILRYGNGADHHHGDFGIVAASNDEYRCDCRRFYAQ